jgi:hypothetical protein|tara:strand:+ start:763 stop:1038 length:276 start_codon:yes stop_codon:yes gene_type:complete
MHLSAYAVVSVIAEISDRLVLRNGKVGHGCCDNMYEAVDRDSQFEKLKRRAGDFIAHRMHAFPVCFPAFPPCCARFVFNFSGLQNLGLPLA